MGSHSHFFIIEQLFYLGAVEILQKDTNWKKIVIKIYLNRCIHFSDAWSRLRITRTVNNETCARYLKTFFFGNNQNKNALLLNLHLFWLTNCAYCNRQSPTELPSCCWTWYWSTCPFKHHHTPGHVIFLLKKALWNKPKRCYSALDL